MSLIAASTQNMSIFARLHQSTAVNLALVFLIMLMSFYTFYSTNTQHNQIIALLNQQKMIVRLDAKVREINEYLLEVIALDKEKHTAKLLAGAEDLEAFWDKFIMSSIKSGTVEDSSFATECEPVIHAIRTGIVEIVQIDKNKSRQAALDYYELNLEKWFNEITYFTEDAIYIKDLAINKKHEETDRYELTLWLSSASLFILALLINFIFNRNLGTATIRVISDLNNAQSLLVQSVKETEQANQAKSDFLANMSHELRTPINSILGMTQLLDKKLIKPKNKEMFDIIKTSSESLLNIVNDILDLSKIEAKEVQLEHIGFDVFERLHHVIQSVMPQINKKGLSINYDADAKQMLVLGDPLRFERILTNLVSNAIRYTNEGGITIKLTSLENDVSDQAILRCEVIGTGIGIPKDRRSKIFGKFIQADTSVTRLYGGTGLGLTISKKLVELMHGKIGFESEVGKGSRFWFEIPFETTDKLHLSPSQTHNNTALNAITISAIPVETINILVAEDHEMNQFFVKKMFKNLGIKQYKIVENGKQAVEEIQKGQYDLLVMDCHMPKMNGYVATETIRKLDDKNKRNIPIIAMTANAMTEDKARCLDVGMDDYVCKPVDIEIFRTVLSQWIKF